MKKLFVLLLFLLSFSTFAYGEEGLYGGYIPNECLGNVELDSLEDLNVYEYNPRSRTVIPDWLNNCSREYYDYMGTLENGSDMQGVYDKFCTALYYFTYDYGAKTTTYKDRQFVVIDATDHKSIDLDTFMDIYSVIESENPQYFYMGSGICTFTYGNSYYIGIQVADEYVDGAARIAEADAITMGIAEYDDIIDINMSNYAIEKKVHDKLILDNTYALDSNGYPDTSLISHSIVGSLNSQYGGGVCESYAKTFKLLMNRYNVECFYVTGYAGSEGHAWNYVKLDDGNFYCVDTTWDDPTGSKVLRYLYFNMPYTEFYSNRNNSLTTFPDALPQCSDLTTYYSSNPKLSTGMYIDDSLVYTPPEVSEDETRVVTVTEATTEATTELPDYGEMPTEETTSNMQFVVENSPMNVTVIKDNNYWQKGKFTNGSFFAAAMQNGASMSVYTDRACALIFNFMPVTDGNTLTVKIDDKAVLTDVTTGGFYSIPDGVHKTTFVFNTSTNNFGALYNISFTEKGDYNTDGVVDITDAVNILSLDIADTVEILIADMNNDNVVGHRDVAMILKKIINNC